MKAQARPCQLGRVVMATTALEARKKTAQWPTSAPQGIIALQVAQLSWPVILEHTRMNLLRYSLT